MATDVAIVDTLNLSAKAWAHRKVNSRLAEFTNNADERLIRISFNAHQRGQFAGPRHRHNFDQVRFVIEGGVRFGKTICHGGDCIYFPEGVFYGPTEVLSGVVHQCTIQTQGPSWALLPTQDQMNQATEQLGRVAEVDRDKGIVRWPHGGAQDGYEAAWEMVSGEKMHYPAGRLDTPCFLHSEHFTWQPSISHPGVQVKPLAGCNAAGPNIKLVKLDAGAKLSAGVSDSHRLIAIISGQADYEDASIARGTLMYYPPDSSYRTMRAREETTLLIVEFRPRYQAPNGWGL
jgi:ChrR Cupin-like domain